MLCGGIGASRLAAPLSQAVGPGRLTLVVNTGDDMWHRGLRICPDLDTNLYALAGLRDPDRGWGLRGDTFRAMDRLRDLGEHVWFNLGDLDLASHLARTSWLGRGMGLTEVTRRFTEALDIDVTVFPMTESEVETHVITAAGDLHFQEFLVKRGATDMVERVVYRGVDDAVPSPGVIDAITAAELVVIAPSNPVASIAPILALPGLRQALASRRGRLVAVTPIVTRVQITDPGEQRRADSRTALMAAWGLPHRAAAVAGLYPFARAFVLDVADAEEAEEVEAVGVTPVLARTIVSDPETARRLAETVLSQA